MSNRRSLVGIILIFIIIIGDLITGIASTHVNTPDPQAPLGQWKSFPPSSSCDVGLGFPFNVTNPKCELMGNSTYRQALHAGSAGITGVIASLSVSCIKPSNTVGASLSLQYALYDQNNHVNSSNWQTGSAVPVDNSATWPCPGNLVSNTLSLNSTSGTGYIFRVVGADGGGSGDNPRFSQVGVTIYETFNRVFSTSWTGLGGTTFTPTVWISVASVSPTIAAFRWFATNVSATNPSCGTNLAGGTDHCWERGASTCTIAANAYSCSPGSISYTTAFTGNPTIILQVTTAPATTILVTGELALLKVQTITA